MSNFQIEIQPQQILAAVHQHLANSFFGQPKTEAKQLFKRISNGESVPFMEISSDDKGDVVCAIGLDHSEYVGKLNFSAFRDVLASHLRNVGEILGKKEDLNVFSNEQTGDILFNIPGMVARDGDINVLVTGIEQRKAGELTVKLMFLDPDNFVDKGKPI